MIIGVLAVIISIVLIILIIIALKEDYKECDFEVHFNIKGFKLSLKQQKIQ